MNYYAALEVEQTATDEELKRAYRRLALVWHPDKHPAESDRRQSAEQRFKDIAEAYECLRDPDRRRYYDRYGVDPERQRVQGGAGASEASQGPASYFAPSSSSATASATAANPFFASMFNNRHNNPTRAPPSFFPRPAFGMTSARELFRELFQDDPMASAFFGPDPFITGFADPFMAPMAANRGIHTSGNGFGQRMGGLGLQDPFFTTAFGHPSDPFFNSRLGFGRLNGSFASSSSSNTTMGPGSRSTVVRTINGRTTRTVTVTDAEGNTTVETTDPDGHTTTVRHAAGRLTANASHGPRSIEEGGAQRRFLR